MTAVFKIIWTEKSVDDLLSIKEFIAADSEVEADAWVKRLYEAGESLDRFSSRGREVPEFRDANIRELLIENYRLVYRLKESNVEILTVFEGHRQLKKSQLKK